MLAAAYGTASDIEILWTLIAAVGLVFSTFNVFESKQDLEFLRHHSISNGRKYIGKAAFTTEMSRAVIQALFLVIGVLAMFLPEVPSSVHLPWKQVVAGSLIRWGLIISSALLTYQSHVIRVVRKTVRET